MCASEVSHLELKHLNQKISPATFTVKPTSYSFKAKLPVPEFLAMDSDEKQKVAMRATQLPVLINNATTCHKLQGCGVHNLFVHSWLHRNNWVYVMLSRVKTLKGLFLRLRLSNDISKYRPPQSYLCFMQRMKTMTPRTENEYSRFGGHFIAH